MATSRRSAEKPTSAAKASGEAKAKPNKPSKPAKDLVRLPGGDDPSAIERMVGHAAQDIGSFIRAQREAAEVSLRQLAERTGVSNPYLSQIERGLRKPSAEVLGQIAKGLRVSAEVLYMRAGILEDNREGTTRDALVTARELTDKQRIVLVEIYDAFIANNGVHAPNGHPDAGDDAASPESVDSAKPDDSAKPVADTAAVPPPRST